MYKISFDYKGNPVEIKNDLLKELYTSLLDWLDKNGYTFTGSAHSTFNRRIHNISEVKELLSTYQMSHFYNINNSGKYILYNDISLGKIVPNIKKMLVNFGISESSIKTKGLDHPQPIIKRFVDIDDDSDIETDIESNDTTSDRYFLLGAWGKETGDLSKTYVDNGYWLNGYAVGGEDKFKSSVNKIPVGGNVVIKATYVKGGLSMMEIRAKGIVTKNYNDGTKLDVNWDKNFKSFKLVESRLGAYRSTVHELKNTELIDLIFNHSESDRIIPPTEFIKTPEKPKVYVKNPFRQSICVLGDPGAGKSTTVRKILRNEGYRFQIWEPSAATTGLLSQYSSSKPGYIPSKVGKLMIAASKDPENLYTFVIEEAHKSSVIEMINDELKHAISLRRFEGDRFVPYEDSTEYLSEYLEEDDGGNLKVPDNFGFIFISSKPKVIANNGDIFDRLDIIVLKNWEEEKIQSVSELLSKVLSPEEKRKLSATRND